VKPNLELNPRHLRQLLSLLSEHAPDAEVWAYGSRATGGSHEGSDLDLVLRHPEHPGTPQSHLHRLRAALSESDLPIVVEVLDWARIPDAFRREIERQHVVVAASRPAVKA